MKLTFTIPDDKVNILEKALADYYAVPKSKNLIRKMTIEFWKDKITNYQLDQARKEAEKTIVKEIDIK